jgi:LacI family transcriptional regulator
MSGVERMGLSIPENVSILGFDDIDGSAETYPALSTIRQPVNEMAASAVNLLMSLIEDSIKEEGVPPRTLVKPQLVERQSCAPPKK